ncbi:sulfatase [Sphingobacterium hungaricum]|uniref:Heparan N-sulfatase n=1 Tax=Sphingobacterium hungaricum TaxID=2082723 RepID=A0A928YPL5_9SPHI|nr:sulfatase [Sphingobacterium hungaricum]MBE8712647.1 heparan N-sulfatase [Sphingobacterium hungaricum]
MCKYLVVFLLIGAASLDCSAQQQKDKVENSIERPNILFVITDDQSFPHASAYGYSAVRTPNFDRVAKKGILFTKAYVASPGCSPSRAAILTGRHNWQTEEAGTHGSSFPSKFKVYPDILEEAGYKIGYTGKGWGPGNWGESGRKANPAGPAYNSVKFVDSPEGVSKINYAENFRQFYAEKKDGQPFCFWFGAHEPHRPFAKGIGQKNGKKLEDVVVPDFLPDTREVRNDILDYCFEIEWFDQQLGKMLAQLEENGELDNTLVIVTSDNGMPFPRAKANTYDYGLHVPLVVSWPASIRQGWVNTDVFTMINIAPTILEAAQVNNLQLSFPMWGRSVLKEWLNPVSGSVSHSAFAARERHSSSRFGNLGYPQRAIRRGDYLYIRNFKPDLWPAGDPYALISRGQSDKLELSDYGAFYDIDAAPSLTFLVENRENKKLLYFLDLATAKRPWEELYNVETDPSCIYNLAGDTSFSKIKAELKNSLEHQLIITADPRLLGDGDVFETYPRLEGVIRAFPRHE